MSKDDLHARVENDFTYHQPTPGDGRAERYEEITRLTRFLAHNLIELCPESRDLSLAITHLEDVRMRANKAIACNPPQETGTRPVVA